jgi:hypothetical protein
VNVRKFFSVVWDYSSNNPSKRDTKKMQQRFAPAPSAGHGSQDYFSSPSKRDTQKMQKFSAPVPNIKYRPNFVEHILPSSFSTLLP